MSAPSIEKVRRAWAGHPVLTLDDGKYKVYQRPDGSYYVTRHDEAWMDLTGDKFTSLLIEAAIERQS